MHFKWNYTPPAAEQENAAKDLGEKLGINPILASAYPTWDNNRKCGKTILSSAISRPYQPVFDEGYGCGCRPSE